MGFDVPASSKLLTGSMRMLPSWVTLISCNLFQSQQCLGETRLDTGSLLTRQTRCRYEHGNRSRTVASQEPQIVVQRRRTPPSTHTQPPCLPSHQRKFLQTLTKLAVILQYQMGNNMEGQLLTRRSQQTRPAGLL